MGHVLILLPEPLWQQPSPICRARHKRERSPGPPDDSCFLQAGSHPVGQAVLVWASLDVGSKRVHTAAPHGRHGDSLEELDAFTFTKGPKPQCGMRWERRLAEIAWGDQELG